MQSRPRRRTLISSTFIDMIRHILIIFCFFGLRLLGFGQSNFTVTSTEAASVLHGAYNPSTYALGTLALAPSEISEDIVNRLNADSLQAYIVALASFENRNTGSDTLSATRGIGAARRWVYASFERYATQSNGRLVPTYFQFDQAICGMAQHRNILAVLPGMDTANHQIILIEGHMDSRCDTPCDTVCLAQGVEDNATGTALVMELARVMAQNEYPHTLVFMVTIGEEQGLYGAGAFAQYADQEGLPIKAVLNNDVIGGIICGQTSSAPSCPGLNAIDSTQVRLFSSGGFNSAHKQLARYVKWQYQEELSPIMNATSGWKSVPMQVSIMAAEDRTGRGGDHIPFRQRGFSAIRFTSANEHGNASNGPSYADRQHTSNDILGVDTDGDNEIDSFYVDFHYLGRNALINANAAVMVAYAPTSPIIEVIQAKEDSNGTVQVEVHVSSPAPMHRVMLRTTQNDFDTVTTLSSDTSIWVTAPTIANVYFVSACAATLQSDGHRLESLFSQEKMILAGQVGIEEQMDLPKPTALFTLLQNRPNPFDESTWIGIHAAAQIQEEYGEICITDMTGRLIKVLPITLHAGVNEVLYRHGYGEVGTYIYSLFIRGTCLESKKMIFAN